MHARRRAALVLLVAALAAGGITLAPAAGSRPVAPLGETTSTTCVGSSTTSSTTTSTTSSTTTSSTTTTSTSTTTTSTTSTTIFVPTIPTTIPTTMMTIFPGPAGTKAVPCPTTTTTTTTTTTAAPDPPTTTTRPATTVPPTTSTTADTSSEESGSIEINADQSRATVRPGGDLEVSTNVGDIGDDEEPIEPGTRLEAQVKVAEGDTEPLFTVSAEVEEDGSVSFDVTFPEDTEPGVYLVVVVLPGAVDEDGNVLRRPRVAIASVVVRGRAGRSIDPDTKRADATLTRFGGADRYETAEVVATETFGTTVLAPIVASGESFPDALAASYIAGAMRTPILLTPSDTMAPGLPAALTALGATGVEIVGGTGAVSEAVQAEIEAAGFVTTRIGGGDRYDTARQIATLIPREGVGQLEDNGHTAVLVNGTAYADALAAGPMSYSQGWPILLTERDGLHPMARAALDELDIDHVIVVGGTAAIGAGVLDDLATAGVTAERVAGTDRADTALAVAEFLYDRLSYEGNDVLLARSDDFADALAAAPRAGDEIMPILLVTPDALGDAARTFIQAHHDVIEVVEVVGGTAAVSDAVRADALTEARRSG